MRIVIVEDHTMMRDLLRTACGKEFGQEIVAEAATGPEAVEAVLRTCPDLLILDLQLPGCDGLSVLRKLRELSAPCRVLILSSYCNDYTTYLVDKARVDGFVDKNSSTVSDVRKALLAIARGDTYFSQFYRETKSAHRRDPQAFDKLLSDREQSILVLIGNLLTDQEAATILGISAATIAKHRFNILKKLGISSTRALARYAREKGFTVAPMPQPPH